MSRLDRRFRRSTRARGEGGAAAIEFALVFPIFVMLTFGMISAGFAFFYNIQIAQAARDAARFGSTFDMPAEGVSDGLTKMAHVAAAQSGWPDSDDDGVPDTSEFSDKGLVCVAFLGLAASDDRAVFGPGDQDMLADDPACFEDGQTGARVQVLINREATLNAVLFAWDLDLHSTSVIPWESRTPAVIPP